MKMMDVVRRIREFFKENPRMWIVVGVAVLVAGIFVWLAYRGSSVNVSQSSAAAEPPAFTINSTEPLKHGEKLSVSWSATNAVRCDAQGWFETGSANQGTAESAPIDACVAGTTNQVGVNCTYIDGQIGVAVKSFTVDTTTCPTTTTTPTPTPGSTGAPVPSGACTKRADGLWYCPNLTCGLAGNGANPPAGPATSIDVKQFRTVCNDVEVPNRPQVGCKIFMDATPKIGALEGYPSKDPAWTCTGPAAITETEGRYCYTPFAVASAPGAVTCCTNTGLSGDCVSFTVAPASTTSGTTAPPATGTPAAAALSLVCGATSNALTWNIPARANSNTLQRFVPGGTWVNVFTDATLRVTSYTDTSPVTGAQYRHKSGANVASNIVSCSGSLGGGSTTIVQGPPVTCSPARQTAKINETVRATTTGGTNVYTWNITQGGSIVAGGNEYVGVSYRTSGTKTLRVSSGGSSAVCTIDVSGDVASTTPPPPVGGSSSSAQLFVTKTERNVTSGDPTQRTAVSVYPGQTIQFSIQVQNIGAAAISGVVVQDTLPIGMSFVAGSTLMNGSPIPGDNVIGLGLSTDAIPAGATVRVQWSAIADQTYSIAPGPNYSSPAVVVSPGGVLATTSDDVVTTVQVTVFGGSSNQQQAGEVPTGPGDAVLMALLTAAALTLLYSGYTRSSAYLRREVADIGNQKDPLDFRS